MYFLFKRLIDIAISLSLIIFFSPLFIIICLLIFIIDCQYPLYISERSGINGKKFKLRIWAGLLVWFFLALASTMLVQYSDIDNLGVFLYGMFVGFIIYAVYNFTNYATIQKYSIKTVAADTLWGTLLFGVVSIICNQISIN